MGHARLCRKLSVFFGAIGWGNLIRTYGICRLMWIFWTERNRRSFEATEKSLVQLQALCQKTLFDWSRYWGSSNCSSIIEFLSSLRISP